MKLKLFFIRRIKGLFLKLKLHNIFPHSFFVNLAYLSKFSKWRSQLPKIEYDDFYTGTFVSNKRLQLFDYLLKKEKLDQPINYLEFGVYFGNSFKWWVANNPHADSRFYGFDTFEGLPEDWNLYKKGEMTTNGQMPEINDKRHRFLKGLFQETLPGFIRENLLSDKRLVINIDADLYTSTLYVLTMLAPYLKKDDLIIFDEYGVPMHEFKAWDDFHKSYYVDYVPIAASNNYYQLAIKIK